MKFRVKHCKYTAEGVGIIYTSTQCCNFACNFFQCTAALNWDGIDSGRILPSHYNHYSEREIERENRDDWRDMPSQF